MAILQWNIRGLRANYEELLLLLKKGTIVAGLQETLLTNESQISISGFNNLHSNKGRGVSLLLHNSLLYSQLILQTELDAIAAQVSLRKTVTVCTLYLSPSKTVSKTDLEGLLEQLPKPYILIGDLNGHSPRWGSDHLNPQGKIIESLIDDHNLCVLNTGSPTFCAPSGTLSNLDLSICSPELFLDLVWQTHSDLCGSDHFPIHINFTEHQTEDSPLRWKFNKADWESFDRLTTIHITNDLITLNDPAFSFSETLVQCAKDCIPKTSATNNKPKTPWFDEDCKEIICERKRALRNFNKMPTLENKILHQKLRAKSRFIFKQKKKQSWKTFCSKLNHKTSTKKVWKVIRKIKGKGSRAAVQCLKQHGETITDKKKVANLLASTIHHNSSTEHYSPKFQNLKQKAEQKSCSFQSDNSENYNIPFTLNELKDSILKSNNSASGPDDIHYQLISHLSDSALLVLLNIFNYIWSSGSFPPSWREAVVVPIPKPGKDHSDPNNYRPIALTSCLCKTMERMIYERLLWQLEHIQALDPTQCGFRKGRCTTDHLVRFESFIRDALVNGKHVVSVLFDLEKAYDTAWKYGILKDLESLGFRGNLPIFIENFLTDRSFQIRIGSTLSDSFKQEMGVPQGSILSPLLFNIKINNIVNNVRQGIDKSLFVDDFSISAKGKTLAGVERQLQLCINQIQKWVEENGFKFSSTKTECIHFHRKQNQNIDPVINLYNQPIKVSKQVKFLGLIFDTKLSFLPHIKYVKEKCQQGLNILKVISHTDWGADRQTLLLLYRSLVRSRLDYGCIVYGSARNSYLKILDPIHHQALRICLGAFHTSPKESLYAQSGEPPLENRRLNLSMKYFLKIKANPENPAYDYIINPMFEEKYLDKPSEIPPFGIRIRPYLLDAGINIDSINDDPLQTVLPPWKIVNPRVNFKLTCLKKDCTSETAYKQLYLEQCSFYTNYEKIFTDGSLKDDRVAAAAVPEKHLNKPTQLRLPDFCSIYSAELKAILLALKYIYQSKHSRFLIISDSLSALQAISTRKISHPFLADIHDLHSELILDGKDIVFLWVPSHMGIRGNTVVDKAAKDALNFNIPSRPFQFVPFADLNRKVKTHCHKLWQDDWTRQVDNKLFKIMPDLYDPLPRYAPNRKTETILTRLHIGHTYTTHSYILKKEEPPWCYFCDTPYTVKHFMTECSDLIEIKDKHYEEKDLNKIYREVSPEQIFAYLKEIDLFYKI